MNLIKSCMKTIDYYGMQVTVPKSGYLAIDRSGEVWWFSEEPVIGDWLADPCQWLTDNRADASCFKVAEAEPLNDNIWKHSLFKIH